MTNKHIILLHGAGVKPDAADYLQLWRQAIAAGLTRDRPKQLPLFEAAQLHMPYFGDLTNALLESDWDRELDLRDRQLALQRLTDLNKTKQFRRVHYESLPGKSPLKEFAADIGAPLTHLLGMGKLVKGKVVPELGAYWNNTNEYATQVDTRTRQCIADLLATGEPVLILSHCLGSVTTYNTLWHLSHEADGTPSKVDLWLTLGSPIADDTVRNLLEGRRQPAERRYPTNIVRWANIAAEDDYFCHDETMANDYRPMLSGRHISEITDYGIYNLAVRYGRSEPHHSAGYLVHPRTTSLIADWLAE